MRRIEKTGETWTIYGKEITPVMNVYGNSGRMGEKTGALAMPGRFFVRFILWSERW